MPLKLVWLLIVGDKANDIASIKNYYVLLIQFYSPDFFSTISDTILRINSSSGN
jgi:hypothetical protein